MKSLLILTTFIATVFANPKYPEICGLENKPADSGRIIGGQEAARNQFPWLAAVLAGGYCTGSVLDENWVITAKHCVTVGHPAWAKAGVHNRFDGNIEPHMQDRRSDEIHVSPHGDFALMKMHPPFELNEFVRPVCLPSRADIANTFVGVNATITGWGVQSFDSKVMYPELYFQKGVKVEKCSHPDNILCSNSDNGVSICFGDSGGPLNYEFQDGKYMQIGVNQFVSSGTCVGGWNGYARLTSHLDFIQGTTGIIFE
uniref:Collagenase n=1 Tax=Caligus clemensi TaxID=344056 RepID=C1C1Z6_CALCM|nr:Collagenase precursor [Caligus clemensi]